MFPALLSTIAHLEAQPILYPLTQEVVGANVPKTLTTRNHDERLDVAAGQFGGTLAFFGSGLLLDRLLKPFFEWVNKKAKHPVNAKHWTILGKSFAIFAVQGALYWAIPFLRNYATAKRTGTGSFTELITGGHKQAAAQSKDVKEKMAYFKDMFSKIVSGGLAASAASVGLASLAIRRGWGVGKAGRWMLDKLALGGGSFKNYPKLAQFLFIAVASYAGWIHAVRDKLELKEQLLQFASFVFGWFVPPKVFDKIFGGQFKNAVGEEMFRKIYDDQAKKVTLERIHRAFAPGVEKLDKTAIDALMKESPAFAKASKLYAKQTLWGLLTSILLLSVTPQLINIWLSKKRLANSQPKAQPKAPPIPRGDLQWKPFEDFARA